MKPKLLFKIWKFPFLSETFVLEQILTAIECGYEVKILVGELQDVSENKLESFFQEHNIQDKVILEDYRIPSGKLLRILKAVFIGFSHVFEFKTLLSCLKFNNWNYLQLYQFHFFSQLEKFDIIHIQYGTNVKPLDLYKKCGLIEAKVIVSFHGHDAFFPINGIIKNNNYYNDLFGYGDLIVANTEYLASTIQKLGCPQNKIEIIPVGVDTNFFSPFENRSCTSEVFKLISVGRLDRVKGQKFAIDALDILKRKGFKVHLSILGEGDERQNLEEIIEEKGLAGEVFLKGKKSPKEVKSVLGEHDIFILAAVPVENGRRETQGLATLEAQACGLPVVVFDSGGVKYTVRDGVTGFIVPEYDVEALASRIEKLITDPELRITMGKNAVEFVRSEFSQQKLRKMWRNVYSKIINNA